MELVATPGYEALGAVALAPQDGDTVISKAAVFGAGRLYPACWI